MAIDIYSTVYMAAALKEMPKVFTFVKDRYFGGNADVFTTEKVIVDYDDGAGNLMAPFVIPRAGSVPMQRAGYNTYELVPAYIAPSRPLGIDDITKRKAGESIVSTMTPAQRERQYLLDDLAFLDDAITRREEWMCVNTMLDNACEMKHIGDKQDKPQDFTVQYYDGEQNDGVFVPDEKWDIGTETKRGTWYGGVAAQAENLVDAGREVTDLVIGSEVSEMILSDPWVQKVLDNRRMEFGVIDPARLPNGVVYIGNLNFSGIALNIFSYRGTYQERDPETRKLTTKNYFPTTGAMLAAPNCGKMLYGAVTQVELDNNTYTRTGTRVPKYNVDSAKNLKETIVTARPLAVPNMKSPWRACRDVLNV